MSDLKYVIGQPGGPAGPFWSVVRSDGRVIAMWIPDEETARRIVDAMSQPATVNAELLAAAEAFVRMLDDEQGFDPYRADELERVLRAAIERAKEVASE